jgi:hypothetical protein
MSIVEYKVEQTRFFLDQISNAGLDFFAVQCFTDAFASSCRSITLSMQAVINEVSGFKAWYSARVETLKKDPLMCFFNDYRNASAHIGETVVGGGVNYIDEHGNRKRQHFFKPIPDLTDVPSGDVFTICRTHFTNLVGLVFDAFDEFRHELDDRWYYTQEHFRMMGKSFEDAIVECGLPRVWVEASSGLPESERWRVLRSTQTVGCQLNSVFARYLGKTISGPDDDLRENSALT